MALQQQEGKSDVLECPSCFRVFHTSQGYKVGDPCPATDHCPSYFEERGLEPPEGT